MPAVWAYCRVSTRKEEQEQSLDEQCERAKRFALEVRCDLRLFREQFSAKTLAGRQVLSGLIDELKNLKPRERPRYVYVTQMDRLGRDMNDCGYLGQVCRGLKVALQIGNESFSLNTFEDRLKFLGLSIAGDAENQSKSQRMKDSWARRRREGKPTSNKVPYGLQLRGEHDIPVPESAKWVRDAFEWYAQGIGMHVIGKRMDGHAPPHTWLTSRIGEDGERITKTRAGTRWESLRVSKLLRQDRYRGTIVSPELFEAVQRRRKNTPKSGSRTERE